MFYLRVGYLYTSATLSCLSGLPAASRSALSAGKSSVGLDRGESGEDLRLELLSPVSRDLGSVTLPGIEELGSCDRLGVAT